MIRGVNRQIIEVNDTQSEFFERAIFFVRPECREENERKLHLQAVKFVEKNAPTPVKAHSKGKKYHISRKALWLMLGIMTVSTVALIVLHFFL